MSAAAWHDPTNYFHGSYVILVRMSGAFIHYTPTATQRNPTVATDNSILQAVSPISLSSALLLSIYVRSSDPRIPKPSCHACRL